MRRMTPLIVAASCAVLAAACDSSRYEDADFRTIPAGGWAYGDTLSFEPGLEDSVVNGRLAVSVRHTSAYIFENLWLEVTVPAAGCDTAERVDTVNVRLADTYGKWLGRGSGVSYVRTDTLPVRYVIQRGHPVTVRHIMRVDTVADLEQIGVVFINDTVK